MWQIGQCTLRSCSFVVDIIQYQNLQLFPFDSPECRIVERRMLLRITFKRSWAWLIRHRNKFSIRMYCGTIPGQYLIHINVIRQINEFRWRIKLWKLLRALKGWILLCHKFGCHLLWKWILWIRERIVIVAVRRTIVKCGSRLSTRAQNVRNNSRWQQVIEFQTVLWLWFFCLPLEFLHCVIRELRRSPS